MMDAAANTVSPKVVELMDKMRKAGCLPALNENVQDICRLTHDSATCAADLAGVIMRDCGLTSNILVAVNSSVYAAKLPVKTISGAVVFLGFEKIYMLALGLSIFKQNCNANFNKELFRLYASSYFSGMMSMAMARERRLSNPEEIFVAGLMYQLPNLALAYTFPEKFRDMQQLVNKFSMTLNNACKQTFGATYDEICAAVLKLYHIPGKVEDVLLHPRPDDPVLKMITESASIVGMIFGGKAGGKAEIGKIEERLKSLLGIKSFSLTEFIKTSCRNDPNVARFFNLGNDDVEMMVQIMEWGKDNPARVIAKLGIGEGLEDEVPTEVNMDAVFNQYIQELYSVRKAGADINQVLLLAEETIFQSLRRPNVIIAFVENGQYLKGRFYVGENLLIKATELMVPLNEANSPLITSLFERKAVRWQPGGPALALAPLLEKRLRISHAIMVPIVVEARAIGMVFITRSSIDDFTPKEENWLSLIMENVELAFERIRSVKS